MTPLTALVTGASRGLGAALADALNRRGWRLVVDGRDPDRLTAAVATLPRPDLVTALPGDVADPAHRAELARAVGDRLHLLVNNAGSSWRATFGDGGFANVQRHMALNFDAQVRLTEALLPLLRQSAPSAVVNIGSVAGRVARARTGAYSASKFALAGWTEAVQLEEAGHGVHIGLVQPGFVATEGFPQRELLARPWTRWMVSTEDKVAKAVLDVWRNRRPEAYVPKPYGLVPVARVLLAGVYRRAVAGGAFTATPKQP